MYAEISDVGSISRRYFVMNAFDGALTMLGVVIGASLVPNIDPLFIILAGLSGSFAMCISGISGAYMTESAEREREMRTLERAMLSSMDDTVHRDASKFATVLTSLVDGFSPALAALIVISPFFMVNAGWITMDVAFPASISLTMLVLLVLGLYLAKISDQSLAKYGLRMLIVGLVTALMCALVAIALGAPAV
ncbi:MAG: VIT1/CCC1 transporter family protein [Thermoplasmata archaeon]|nr:VIT1/CCC1 transporter family protein [Thermoplasmata archaeon]